MIWTINEMTGLGLKNPDNMHESIEDRGQGTMLCNVATWHKCGYRKSLTFIWSASFSSFVARSTRLAHLGSWMTNNILFSQYFNFLQFSCQKDIILQQYQNFKSYQAYYNMQIWDSLNRILASESKTEPNSLEWAGLGVTL